MAFDKLKSILPAKFRARAEASSASDMDEHSLLMGEGAGIAERLQAEYRRDEATKVELRGAPRVDFT